MVHKAERLPRGGFAKAGKSKRTCPAVAGGQVEAADMAQGRSNTSRINFNIVSAL